MAELAEGKGGKWLPQSQLIKCAIIDRASVLSSERARIAYFFHLNEKFGDHYGSESPDGLKEENEKGIYAAMGEILNGMENGQIARILRGIEDCHQKDKVIGKMVASIPDMKKRIEVMEKIPLEAAEEALRYAEPKEAAEMLALLPVCKFVAFISEISENWSEKERWKEIDGHLSERARDEIIKGFVLEGKNISNLYPDELVLKVMGAMDENEFRRVMARCEEDAERAIAAVGMHRGGNPFAEKIVREMAADYGEEKLAGIMADDGFKEENVLGLMKALELNSAIKFTKWLLEEEFNFAGRIVGKNILDEKVIEIWKGLPIGVIHGVFMEYTADKEEPGAAERGKTALVCLSDERLGELIKLEILISLKNGHDGGDESPEEEKSKLNAMALLDSRSETIGSIVRQGMQLPDYDARSRTIEEELEKIMPEPGSPLAEGWEKLAIERNMGLLADAPNSRLVELLGEFEAPLVAKILAQMEARKIADILERLWAEDVKCIIDELEKMDMKKTVAVCEHMRKWGQALKIGAMVNTFKKV